MPADQSKEEKPGVITPETLEAELEKRKSSFPSNTYEKAKRLIGRGVYERTLVSRLLRGTITQTLFHVLHEYLVSPTGKTEEVKKLKTQLARQHLTGVINAEKFEIAAETLEYGQDEHITLIKEFLKEKWSLEKLKRKLKKKPEILKKILKEHHVPETPEQKDLIELEINTIGSRLKMWTRSVKEIMEAKIPPEVDREPFLKETEEFKRISKLNFKAQDDMETFLAQMSKGNTKLFRSLMVETDKLFPEAFSFTEKEITEEQVKEMLARIGSKHGVILTSFAAPLYEKIHHVQRMQNEALRSYKKLGEIMRGTWVEVEHKAMLNIALEKASEQIGIPLKEGQRFRYKTYILDTKTEQVIKGEEEAEIIAIRFEEPTYTDDITKKTQKLVGGGFVLVTGLGALPLAKFKKWVDASDAYSIIKNKEELEKTVGFDTYGIKIKEGLTVEYDTFHGRDKEGNLLVKPETVTIQKIQNGQIFLDKPIDILKPGEASDSGFVPARTKQVLTYGEFAKWVLRRTAVPQPKDLKDMNRMLKSLNEWNNEQFGRNKRFYPAIKTKKGEIVYNDTIDQPPYDRELHYMDAADNKKVVLDDRKKSLGQFLRSAKKEHLEKADAKAEAEHETEPLEEGPDKEAMKEEIENQKKRQMQAEKDEHEGHGEEPKPPKEPEEEKEKIEHKAHEEHEEHVHMSSRGVLGRLWNQTTILNAQDIYELIKAVIEYLKRRWEHNSKSRYAGVGKNMPFIGPEMERIHQAAENQEVKEYEDALTQKGYHDILHVLHYPENRDQMKASFITLSNKGWIKWGDVRMWEMLNKFVGRKDPSKCIPIPASHDPDAIFEWPPGSGLKRTGHDFLEGAIDTLWGQGTYVEWFNKNNGAYNSKTKQAHEKGKQLEGDPKGTGGVTAELQRLLLNHKRGEFVEPAEYEGLITFIIDAGKSSAEAKVYYIVEGVANGLITLERVGAINSEYLNRFPMLDYWTDKHTKKEGQKEEGPWTVEDFKNLANHFDSAGDERIGVFDDKAIIQRVNEYMWKHILTHKATIIRNNKGTMRDPSQIDHDDCHIIFPLCDEELIETACRQTSAGRKNFTAEAYLNGYVGFVQYIKSLAETGNANALVQAIESYVRYDGLLGDRYGRNKDFFRLTDRQFRRTSVVDTTNPTIVHKNQLTELIMEIGKEFGEDFSLIFTKPPKVPRTKDEQKLEKDVEAAVGNFSSKFNELLISKERRQKLIGIVNKFGLISARPMSPREKEIMKEKLKIEEEDLNVFAKGD